MQLAAFAINRRGDREQYRSVASSATSPEGSQNRCDVDCSVWSEVLSLRVAEESHITWQIRSSIDRPRPGATRGSALPAIPDQRKDRAAQANLGAHLPH
jgi:hypothetical protein